MKKLKLLIALILCLNFSIFSVNARELVDADFVNYVRGIQFCQNGSPLAYPVMSLGSTGGLGLVFDDLEADMKRYSYSFQLCDADWQPVNYSSFEYISGFNQNNILTYKNSSISKVNYVHYSLQLTDNKCNILKSGNYILHVYLNGDSAQKVFDRRFLVLDNLVTIDAQILQPFNSQKINSFQKVQFTVNADQLSVVNPNQQVKVVVLQNYRWDNCIKNILPAFITGNSYQYNGERDVLFPAGKEYRWLNLKSFRFYSDRIAAINKDIIPMYVRVLTDYQRTKNEYVPYKDYNGFYYFAATESIDVAYSGDYGKVNFSYATYDSTEMEDKDVYIVGQFNNYRCDNSSKLNYNPSTRHYENNQFLKQGYYTYMYVTKPKNGEGVMTGDATEGNYWQTENDYTILVYYRDMNNRYDQLVGLQTINSRTNIGAY